VCACVCEREGRGGGGAADEKQTLGACVHLNESAPRFVSHPPIIGVHYQRTQPCLCPPLLRNGWVPGSFALTSLPERRAVCTIATSRHCGDGEGNGIFLFLARPLDLNCRWPRGTCAHPARSNSLPHPSVLGWCVSQTANRKPISSASFLRPRSGSGDGTAAATNSTRSQPFRQTSKKYYVKEGGTSSDVWVGCAYR
jgi:hypothetical protein